MVKAMNFKNANYFEKKNTKVLYKKEFQENLQ